MPNLFLVKSLIGVDDEDRRFLVGGGAVEGVLLDDDVGCLRFDLVMVELCVKEIALHEDDCSACGFQPLELEDGIFGCIAFLAFAFFGGGTINCPAACSLEIEID